MQWRLILDGEYSGAWNMAYDEATLLCADESTLPTLRFYHWNPACVSIGRLQKLGSSPHVASSPFPLVRRPTGGRAVLHQHEITYCAVFHQSRLPRKARSVVGAYSWLSQGFIAGLQQLGIRAQLAPQRSSGSLLTANCFQSAAQCDFLIDGKKLIGAAQCRKDDVILQHGSLLLELDPAAWQNAIGGAMEGAVSLRDLGVHASSGEIVAALCRGIESAHSVALVEGERNDEEVSLARCLHSHKYSCDDWNQNGIIPSPG